MGEIIYHIATTVDNFIADLDGNCPASMFVPEGDHVSDFLAQINEYDVVLMGAKTYKYGFKFGVKPGEQGYKGIKHVIFSKSLNFDSSPEVELVRENTVNYVRNLKTKHDKIWLCGGGNLAASLLEHQLLDKLKLKVNPTIAGTGLRLFGESKIGVKLRQMHLKKYESGVMLVTYEFLY